jgi:predicted RNA binding protein YcfA (HicA-like mRNA interferase family)
MGAAHAPRSSICSCRRRDGPHLRLVGKEKGFAISPIRAREMRRFLERNGYAVVPGQHKHLKLRHEHYGDILLRLRPGDNLNYVAVKQIAAVLDMQPEELVQRAR